MCIVKHPIGYESFEDGCFYLCIFHCDNYHSEPKNPNYDNGMIFIKMLTSSRVGTLLKARAFAESNSLNEIIQHIYKEYLKEVLGLYSYLLLTALDVLQA